MADKQQFQYIKLPDGSFAKFPASMKDEEIAAALKQNDPLVSGEGMEQKAHEQAKQSVEANIPAAKTMRQRFTPIGARELTPEQRKFQENNVLPAIQAADVAGGLAVPFAEAGGFLPGLVKLGSSTAGAALGKAGGRFVGGELFGEPGAEVGGVLGGLAGGTIGYRSPEMLGRTIEHFTGPGTAPSWILPQNDPELIAQQKLGAFMNRGYRNVGEPQAAPELGSPENPGWMAKLPTRMPTAQEPEPELGSPENPGFMAKLPTRMPTKVGEPRVVPIDRNNPIPGVSVFPEPREMAPGEKPGSMYSVPRSQLVGAARAGKPGATDVLRDLGRPMVLLPKEGVGYPGPRAEMGAPTLEDFQEILRRRPQIAAD